MNDVIERVNSLTVAALEARIRVHMAAAVTNLIAVGRDLIEAKELIAHGDWQDWVERNTGMTLRSAQRVMQAAREVPAGSAMEGIAFSKVQMILALPEGEREAVAKKTADESLTVKELREEIAKLKAENINAEDAYKSICESKERYKRLCDKQAAEMHRTEGELARHRHMIDSLNAQLDARETPADGISDEAQGIIDEREAEIADLKRELAEAEALADAQAELRQQAQEELTAMQAGGGAHGAQMDAERLNELVCAFLGEADGYRFMGSEFASMSAVELREFGRMVGRVENWCGMMRHAMSTMAVEGVL